MATARCIARQARQARRLYATRAHPLAGPSAPKAPPAALARQRWSTATMMALSMLVGTGTYLIGRKEVVDRGRRVEPTLKAFDAALKELREVLPPDCLSQDRAVLLDHGTSSWSYHKTSHIPGAVAYPRSTDDVVQIVQVASKHSIPLIPYAGGTSLEGHFNVPPSSHEDPDASVPDEDLEPAPTLTLDFSVNMNKLLDVHDKDLDCVVQPGVGYEELNDELKERGFELFFPVDPGPGAQIGGMIGTGCSGTNAVRYGTMRENVINLTAVMADGTVLKTRSRAKKSSAGPNLGQLFIGAEGTLGIVTEATLKLQPVLPTSVGVSSFDSIQDAANTVAGLIQHGVQVACVELLDDVMMKAINQSGNAGKWAEKPSLFIKFSGCDEHVKTDKERTARIVKANGGSKIKLASTAEEAESLWTARKVALWSSLDYVPGSRAWTTDVCVPISNLPELVRRTKRDILDHGLTSTIVGHAGDGNFHAIILFKNDEELGRVKECVHKMVDHAQDLDGTCTGEHGVGLGKLWALERELGKGTVDLLRKLKAVMDPQGILNPGKLIPT